MHAAILTLAMAALPACRNTTRMMSDSPVALGGVSNLAEWAVPLDEPGLPNLHQVSDDLYRGAQPTAQGLVRIRDMGVKTVINVRGGDDDRETLARLGLGGEHIPMSAFDPRDADVVRFLRIVTLDDHTPALVHCQHGADRTGLLCAMYRVVVQGWSRQDAIAEMTRGGMGFHSMCQDLVAYVRNADVERLRREAGIGPVRFSAN